MKNLKEMGVDAETIKPIIEKVKEVVAYQKGKNMTPGQIAAYAVKRYANKEVDHEKITAKIESFINKINSGEIDINKFMKYAKYAQ
jgi:hypothetical protein